MQPMGFLSSAFTKCFCRKCRLMAVCLSAGVLLLTIPAMSPAVTVNLAWDASQGEVAGYRLYYGVQSRQYGSVLDVGTVTNYTVYSLADGSSYYFALKAYDAQGQQSDYSDEIIYAVAGVTTTVPATTTTAQVTTTTPATTTITPVTTTVVATTTVAPVTTTVAPTTTTIIDTGKSVTLSWDASADPVVGYLLFQGEQSRQYGVGIDVGAATSRVVGGLVEGETYYFALKAYDAQGQ
ncbi:MAG: fibronectin type III domain-containing protein, partial [Deltaproteobacteria bacterium]|nr:fibronectin type III domain-containing protein [Deltaproteobacteria bacterium]